MTNPQQAAAYLDEITRLNAEIERLRAELAEAERQIELMYEDLAGDSI